MRERDIPVVRELGLFATMSEAHFNDLMQAAYLQNFPAQVELILEGDPADFLYINVEGCVELYSNWSNRESTLAIIRPVASFILAAVIMDKPYLMSGRTVEKTRVLMIPAENVRAVFAKDEAFARALVEELATSYRKVSKDLKDLKLRSAVERLANRLLRYNREQGEEGTAELLLDKKMLASLLSMTPENLSRAFNTLKAYGVEVDGSHIILNDLESLESLAKPDPLIDDPKS